MSQGFGDDEDLLALPAQVEHGLQHADMGFGAGHHHLGPLAARQAVEALRRDAGEMQLLGDGPGKSQFPQHGDG